MDGAPANDHGLEYTRRHPAIPTRYAHFRRRAPGLFSNPHSSHTPIVDLVSMGVLQNDNEVETRALTFQFRHTYL